MKDICHIFSVEIEKVNRNKKLVLVTIVLIALVLTAVFVISYSLGQTKKLRPGEVNEYQGKNLSAIDDFRENSIEGPQQVDKTTYRLVITGLVNSTLALSYDAVLNQYQSYEKVVTLHCVEG